MLTRWPSIQYEHQNTVLSERRDISLGGVKKVVCSHVLHHPSFYARRNTMIPKRPPRSVLYHPSSVFSRALLLQRKPPTHRITISGREQSPFSFFVVYVAHSCPLSDLRLCGRLLHLFIVIVLATSAGRRLPVLAKTLLQVLDDLDIMLSSWGACAHAWQATMTGKQSRSPQS